MDSRSFETINKDRGSMKSIKNNGDDASLKLEGVQPLLERESRNEIVDIGQMIKGVDGETSMIIPTTVSITPPIKLCDFLLHRKYCVDPRIYKNGVVPDDGDKVLCTLGLCGISPRWCKEYPYQKKKYFKLLKLREFIGNITKSRGDFHIK